MSDMATSSRLAPAASQLPVNWYFDERILALEKQLIEEAVTRHHGNLAAAARLLGLTRPQLSYRLNKIRES